MKIDFTKMNGLGNDFVIIDARHQSVNLNQSQIIKLADRNNSITKGCDQLIMLEGTGDDTKVRMIIYNSDGSEAESCGNATRCVAQLLLLLGEIPLPRVYIETIERKMLCGIHNNGFVEVNMGEANSYERIDLGSEYAELGQAISVNVGNPHCIFIVDDADKITDEYLTHWGSKIENHPLFPNRTNVQFVSKIIGDEGAFRVRVWERGAGITKACGSGAVAVTWALEQAGLQGYRGSDRYLVMDGGTITTYIISGTHIFMQGATEFEFKDSVEV